MDTNLRIGILALHGAIHEHQEALFRVDNKITTVLVKSERDLTLIDGLIIPGGESTTMGILAEKFNLIKPLQDFIKNNNPVMGTCAGLILLSNNFVEESLMEGQEKRMIGGLNVKTWRNYFGSQVESFVDKVELNIFDEPIDGVFIRAPAIIEAGINVEILGKLQHKNFKGEEKEVIVAVKQGNIVCASFHPELSENNLWHKYFVDLVNKHKNNKN